MESALKLLTKTQRLISTRTSGDELLLFSPMGQYLHIEFCGCIFDEGLQDLFQILRLPEIANRLSSFVLRGPDEGANGTRNWDLTPLLESDVRFPHLQSVYIEPTLPEHHNQTIIASIFEEEGQIGRFIAKTPMLSSLTVPSAPDVSFFQTGLASLRHLRVESGYSTENFILNLSNSNNFPHLQMLDFGDYNQRSMENYPDGDEFSIGCTPFEHYKLLIGSKAFSTIRRFILRNSILLPAQLSELHDMKKDCQFMVIQSPAGAYV